MAAGAFHIGGYAARAYSLFSGELETLNLASYERCLVQLMRRDLNGVRDTVFQWMNNRENDDASVQRRLETDDDFGAGDLLAIALTRLFLKAIASFEFALLTGRATYHERAMGFLRDGSKASAESNHVPLWWSFTVARHLLDDLWDNSLHNRLPVGGGSPEWPRLRRKMIDLLASRSVAEVDLWPSQLQAAGRVVDTEDDLVIALPTSAGKTRIAELCILRCLADGLRVVYVTPLRALSAQVEHGLARTFRPLGFSVTSVYGASGIANADIDTLRSAAIVVATPEKLDYAIRQEPDTIDDVGLIVLDEGHMIGLSEREIRYEMLVQRLLRRDDSSQRRLVCLSAVFSPGESFDDFTNWLRDDKPGTAIHSAWRPTRQRPGRLMWNGEVGRLELEVGDEKPFVPRFVQQQTPTVGKRRVLFPRDAGEFLVGATSAFLARGQNVLLYCPQRRYVESTAKAFIESHRQAFFAYDAGARFVDTIADAVRIGTEWLGANHIAVSSLKLGIAVHHGALPRQFLAEIEALLRQGVLRVVICSPTLAQGVDLNFSVLLFKSIYKMGRDPIDAKDFANVVGRVGRAFVDLDGLYVLPLFDQDVRKNSRSQRDFRALISKAKSRLLESGVRLLVGHIIDVLQSRLGGDPQSVREYVLNQESTWEVEAREDEWEKWLDVALNELDTAILGVIDVLDLPTESLADYLDQCLQSSFWQRRLAKEPTELRELHGDVIRGRATWLWSNTNLASRRAFFSAGIGYKAGTEISQYLDDLQSNLAAAESLLGTNEIDTAVNHINFVAKILFGIHPFEPEKQEDNWETLLKHWVKGTALGEFADNTGIHFIQQDVVYRLVWGIETARSHLEFLSESKNDAPGALVAQCLTFGVPTQTSAFFMQAGLQSRTMATLMPTMIGMELSTFDELREWFGQYSSGALGELEWSSNDHQAEWKRFSQQFNHHDVRVLSNIVVKMAVTWDSKKPPRDRVRVRVKRDVGSEATVFSQAYRRLGSTKIPPSIKSDEFTGLVRNDGSKIAVRVFG
ncbi:DEAD/DEAH box helicase [Rhodopirellula sallentina]|nr:DEAD/DEAH box helicase [Rhodopirellula sallentina]